MPYNILVRFTDNPQLRKVLIDDCEHIVSLGDGVDSRGGSSDNHAAIRKRSPWARDCKNFREFAVKEHEIFCIRDPTLWKWNHAFPDEKWYVVATHSGEAIVWLDLLTRKLWQRKEGDIYFRGYL